MPEHLDDADIAAFVRYKCDTARNPKYARKVARTFRLFVFETGLANRFPLPSAPGRDYFFGRKTDPMPEPLRSDLRALVDYKQRPTSRRLPRPTRDANSRLRRGVKIRTVSARENEETVDAYINWQLDERGTSGTNFNGHWMLHAACGSSQHSRVPTSAG